MTDSDFTPPDNATTRFSNRVEHYARYRPGYPPEMIECLSTEFGLSPMHSVADVGSGTGIFSEILLRRGNTVFGVEPNLEMREAARRLLGGYDKFISVAGTAESTTLSAASVDWITSAQAFHWFDVDRCKSEFARILRPGGRVALIWNNRRLDSAFAKDYERFLSDFGVDYDVIRHEAAATDGRVERLFSSTDVAGSDKQQTNGATKGSQPFAVRSFYNSQRCDREALRGRALSASYMPAPDDPRYPAMIETLETIFEQYAQDGEVVLEYETRIYVGTPA